MLEKRELLFLWRPCVFRVENREGGGMPPVLYFRLGFFFRKYWLKQTFLFIVSREKVAEYFGMAVVVRGLVNILDWACSVLTLECEVYSAIGSSVWV